MPAAIPESTKTSLGQRLGQRQRERWPGLASVDVRFRGRFAYVDGELHSPAARHPTAPIEATPRRQQVGSLTERRLADLPGDDRPLPSVDAYDHLLGTASS